MLNHATNHTQNRYKQAQKIKLMFLEENEINNYTLKKIIGEPIKIDFRKFKSIGSRSFFVKSIDDNQTKKYSDRIKIDSKCNIQKFSNGILIRINYSNKINAIALSNDSLTKIKLIRGNEIIKPHLLSLFNLLLKLKVPIRYSRYFALGRGTREYEISETELQIISNEFNLKLITNGYDFENQLPFFNTLNQ